MIHRHPMKVFVFVLLILAGLLPLASCGGAKQPSGQKNPVVTITMDTGKTIKVELYPDKAPNTVNNFIYVIRQGFLDGTIFHRVSPSFMIQGGEMARDLGYTISGEFSGNGFTGNDIKHERGVISMARSNDMNSATTQFFLMTGDAPGLDDLYAAFGRVTEGMDVVDEIANQEWGAPYGDGTGKPAADQVMASVTVDTFGVSYPEPTKR